MVEENMDVEYSDDLTEAKKKPVPTSPDKWSRAKAKARSKFDVYPSVYANSWLVSEYKKAYKKKHGSDNAYEGKKPEKGGLPKWFEEEWVDLSRSDFEKDKWVECGRPDTGQTKADWKKKYPKCLPKAKAKKLWKEGGKKAWDSAVSRKQKAVSNRQTIKRCVYRDVRNKATYMHRLWL